jgi:hypothetical protein
MRHVIFHLALLDFLLLLQRPMIEILDGDPWDGAS